MSTTPGRALALKLWTVLSRARSSVAEHSLADIKRHGLTVGEFGALEALYHKGPLLLGELREKTLVSSGGMTYLVDRLAERGLVERRPCPRDRRASYVALTSEGEALMARIFPDHARWMERAVSGLDDDEKRVAIELLKKVGKEAAALDPTPGGEEKEPESGVSRKS